MKHSVPVTFLSLFLCLLTAFAATAQPAGAQRPWQAGIGISAARTHTGYSAYLLPEVHYRRHTVYAGPKLLLDDSYLPYSNTWGINAGYAYTLLQSAHWQAGAGVDYQCSFYKPYNPYHIAADSHNRVQEGNVFLSLWWRPWAAGRLAAGLSIGSGIYFDTYHDLTGGTRHTDAGQAGMTRLMITYQLF